MRQLFPSLHPRLSIFPDSVWNQDDDQLDFDPILSTTLLVRHVEYLLRIALAQERGHTLINHTAAAFYEMVRQTWKRKGHEFSWSFLGDSIAQCLWGKAPVVDATPTDC